MQAAAHLKIATLLGALAALSGCTASTVTDPPVAPAAQPSNAEPAPPRLDEATVELMNEQIAGVDRQIRGCRDLAELHAENPSIQVPAECDEEHLRIACEKVAELARGDPRMQTAPSCRTLMPDGG
jgi:hypothetical protein